MIVAIVDYGSGNLRSAAKAFERAAAASGAAVEIDARRAGAVPSTKGILGGSLP